MSSMHTIDFCCPQCKEKSPFTVHDSINVTLDPDDKEKVLDKSLFNFHCPHCGLDVFLEYGPLYHDMTNKYMISVCRNEESARDFTIKDIGDSFGGKKFSMLHDGYRFRTVVKYEGLIEKITIFDAGLNDFAVEFVKGMILKQTEGASHLYFTNIDESKIHFFIIFPDSKKNCGASISRDVYDEVVKLLGEKSRKSKVQYVTPLAAFKLLNASEAKK